MVQERKERGLSVLTWCSEHGITEYVHYYPLHHLRLAACQAFAEGAADAIGGYPAGDHQASLRLTTKAGTLEIMDSKK